MKSAWLVISTLGLLGCQFTKTKDIRREFSGRQYFRACDGTDYKIEVRYLPRTLQLLSREGVEDSTTLTNRILDSLESAMPIASGTAFLLKISPKEANSGSLAAGDLIHGGKSGFRSYQESLEAYSFDLKEKIWLESEGRKWPLVSYRMENSFGMTPGRNFILLFGGLPSKGSKRKVDADLVLDDIVPGLARKKLQWTFPVGTYDQSI